MIHLFHKPACPFCWKVLIALAETGLPFIGEVMDPADPVRLAGLSPQVSTPVLVVDGVGVWESAVIAEYISDLADGALMPDAARAGAAEARARVRLLHTYADRIIGPGLREVIFEKRSKPAAAWDTARIARGTAAWEECLDWLEARIEGPGGMVGNTFSLADCALIPRFGLAARFGVGVDARHPRLAEWFAVQERRDSVTTTAPEVFGWVRPTF